MAAHGHEALGLLAVPTLEHPDDGGLEVVIANASGHAAELLEGSDVAVDEDLLGLVGIDPVEGLPRGGQTHDEHAADDLFTREPEADLAEVDFGFFTGRMGLGHVDLGQGHRTTGLDLGHVTAHGRFANVSTVLFDQALIDPPGRVALLLRRLLVIGQPAVDGRLPRVEQR